MQGRVCICCGQSMPERRDYRSRHSHVCAACSAMADEEEASYRPKKKTPLRRLHPAMLSVKPEDLDSQSRRARLR